MAMRIHYENELNLLNQDLREMGKLVETAIYAAFHAFQAQDNQKALEIVKDDSAINDMERRIESRCLSLLLCQQPVAGDLRIVSTALKVVTDLERIGDHAADIAELVLQIQDKHSFQIVKHIPPMAKTAQEMVHDSIESFINQDVSAVKEIVKRDDEVDSLFHMVKNDVITLLKESSYNSDRYIDLLMIAKYLERIGDHAVNVCEWAQFCQTGALNNYKII